MDELRELDVKVAEALGYVWTKFKPAHEEERGYIRALYGPKTWYAQHSLRADGTEPRAYGWDWEDRFPRYSTSIAAAWELVERMRRDRFVSVEYWNSNSVTFRFATLRVPGETHAVVAPTAPEAICRAFLAAVEKPTPPGPGE